MFGESIIMTLLNDLLKENAVAGTTAAHAVASGGGHETTSSLFNGGVTKRKKKKKLMNSFRFDPSTIKTPRTNWGWRIIGEMMDSTLSGQGEESSFDPADVMSKLKNAEKQVEYEDDTVPFGMEDEEGNIVKVYVRADQADEFESALGGMLSGESDESVDGEDEELNSVEIAEVLFKLKDQFDIVDVEWPEIEGDEEEEQTLGGAEGEMGEDPAMGGEMGAEGGMEGGDEMGLGDEEGIEDLEGEGDEMGMDAEGGAESALQQVIDMMKSDAEARKAESEARSAEAEARTAEAHANSAASKVSQEEQILDAEAHEKQQKDEKGETERLAKLARYKHDQANRAETAMAEEEEEEVVNNEKMVSLRRIRDHNNSTDANTISVQSLADALISKLRGSIR